jgi:hypothetical protein
VHYQVKESPAGVFVSKMNAIWSNSHGKWMSATQPSIVLKWRQKVTLEPVEQISDWSKL